jgi:hypothetical protein
LDENPSLVELLANPLSRQKTAASGWLSRAGGNLVHRKTPAKQVNFRALSASQVVFCLDSRLRGNDEPDEKFRSMNFVRFGV